MRRRAVVSSDWPDVTSEELDRIYRINRIDFPAAQHQARRRSTCTEYLSVHLRLSRMMCMKLRSCLALSLLPFAVFAAATENFTGEWADKNFHGNSVFQLSLEQTGSDVSRS